MAHELARAPRAAVYGRIGTTTQAFGTLASWLVDVLNVLTGNLDRAGGAMFPQAAAGQSNSAPGPRKAFRHDRWRSRVRDWPEVLGELPVATLAEEIRTDGPGQIRALITISGNPCLSTPHAAALDHALGSLDFMVSIDPYLNETTRHANVILPTPPALARDHYDLALYQLAVRNVANWTPAAVSSQLPQEWETILRLAAAAVGQGPAADVAQLDDLVAAELARRTGQDLASVAERRGPARLVDLMLRAGPYRLTLADLEAAPHGIDLGPLAPRLPELLSTPSGRVELAPEPIVADVPRLAAQLGVPPPALVLVGRRQLNSNNSWMHNVAGLVRGSNRCTAHVHPDDAAERGIADAQLVTVRSRTGSVTLPAEVTDAVRQGVVSIPHGWGHDVAGTVASVAREHAGVNSNVLADDMLVDVPTGTAVLNGIPIELAPAATG
jgi:anaerobic selenocysteine-containing dehydrogenase